MPTLIKPLVTAGAGEASCISIAIFGQTEWLTAMRNGSGNLELISWKADYYNTAVVRAADSTSLPAGTAHEVALALMYRTAITAVRSGAGRLLLIVWDVPEGLDTMSRLWDSGTTAGEASQIALLAMSYTFLITACRAGNGDLLLIPWRLDPDKRLVRLDPEGVRAGEVSLVTIERIDNVNILTAVRNGSGNLELIGWSVSDTGPMARWTTEAAEAGEVTEIALIFVGSDGITMDYVTAVKNGAGNLLLIAWRVAPATQTITRLTPDGIAAGAASHISVCRSAAEPNGHRTIVASMRRGSGNHELIAFELLPNGPDAATFVRTGDTSNASGTKVTDTSLASGVGEFYSAIQVDGNLQVTKYALASTDPTIVKSLADAAAGEVKFSK